MNAITSDRVIVELQAKVAQYNRDVDRASRNFDNGMRRVQASAIRSERQVKASTTAMSRDVTALGRTFAMAFAGGIFAGGATGLIRSISNLNRELADLAVTADRVGISIEDLQRLRFSFEQIGISANQTDTAMQRFSRRIGEAASGTGVLYEVLKANNIQLRNQDGTMRSQIDLLRDYANLIKNAGSEQEKLVLANRAFDVEGSVLVGVLNEGAAGLDRLMDKTEEAGGVFDEELVRRAAELDTKFSNTWRNFEMMAKRAIVFAGQALESNLSIVQELDSALSDLWNNPSWRNFSRLMLGDGATDFLLGEEALGGGKGGRLGLPSYDQALEQLRHQLNRTATVIPGTDSDDETKRNRTRNRAAAAALREAEAVERLIDSLSHELSLIGMTEVEQAKANALRQAGAAATDAQRQQIESLVESIHRETEAQREAERATEDRARAFENLFQMAGDGLVDIASGSEKAEDAIKRLAAQLAIAAAQAALLGTGPLAGLFGGGSLFGNSAGSLTNLPLGVGLYHSGGVAGSPSTQRNVNPALFAGAPRYHSGGIAGLQPGEVPAILQRGEVVLPKGASPSSAVNVTYAPQIDARGADTAAIARLERALARDREELPARIIDTVRRAGPRNVKLG